MPITKVKGGWKAYPESKTVHKTKTDAEKQLKAIKSKQRKK